MSDRPLLEPLERFVNGDPMDNIWERRCLASEVRGVLERARLAERMYEELCELREQDGDLFDRRMKALQAENERLGQALGDLVCSNRDLTQKEYEKGAELEKPDLQGEIKVGDWFMWEPELSSARELIRVTQVAVNTDGETWIESENTRGERHWNDEQRFHEACTRTEPE